MYNKILPLDKNSQMSWFEFANEIFTFHQVQSKQSVPPG